MRNRALASLPDRDFELLRPYLRPIELVRGRVLHHQDDQARTVCFPLAGMVSTVIHLEDGRAIEAAMTGPEGMLDDGTLGTGITLGDHLVQGDGDALTIGADHLRHAMNASPAISHMVVLAMEISNAYSLRSLVCLNFHQIEARLSRWLLMARYHQGGDELAITHEVMGTMLGVQRTSVTGIAKKLQDDGVIACHRGRISVVNAAALEKRSCDCYSQMTARIEATFPRPH
jgi:CRP-like cAMP-binding protein